MKWKIEKKYLHIAVITLVVIILAISFWYTLEHNEEFEAFKAVIWKSVFPIVVGVVLAYLLNPILQFFEGYIFLPFSKVIWKKKEQEKTQKKFARTFGIICTLVLFFVFLIGGLYLVIPQVYQSLVTIVTDAPSYYNSVVQWLASLDSDKSELNGYILMVLDKIYNQALTYLNNDILPNMDKIVASIASGIVGGLRMLLNLIVAIIISVYVLGEKETLISVAKKLTYSLFNRSNANGILRGVRYVNSVFGGFISGKIIDSFIIGGICYVFMQCFQFDYAVLISVIIGVTNIIPYFGPFIGAIPSILILLMINFKEGIIFAIFVLVLQQVDGNIIGPVILGDRLKISSMWILFAILVGGGLFGVPGMILGAPCFACLYAMVGTICRVKLKSKRLPVATEDYYQIDQIEQDGIHYKEEGKGTMANPEKDAGRIYVAQKKKKEWLENGLKEKKASTQPTDKEK